MRFLFLLTLVGLGGLPLARAECLSPAAVAEIRKDFALEDPEGKEPKLDLCAEKSTAFAALRTLLFVKDLPSLALAKSEFNQNLIDGHPYDYFRARVKKIVLDERTDSDACPDGRLAFVSPYMREEHKFWVCPNAANFGVITLGSAFLHESRHEDGGEFSHKRCAGGPYEGQLSCDETYADGGAYAIGLEFLVKLSRAENLDPVIRERARSLAIADFLQRFNEKPLGIRAGALLRDSEGRLSFFADDKETFFPAVSVHSPLSLQAGLPLVFDPARGAGVYAFREGELSSPASDVLTRLFDGFSPAERKSVRDVLYGDAYACLLLEKSLRCYGPDRREFAVDIPHFRPVRFAYDKHSRLLGPDAALYAEDGFLYRLPETAEALANQDPKSWAKSNAPAAFRVAHPWPGQREIVLKPDGSVEYFSTEDRNYHPAESLRGRKIVDILAPFAWSEKFKEL